MSIDLIEDAVDTLDSEEASAALQELLADKKRLDFLQKQGGGRQWISRPSATGRGYRVYTETSRLSDKTVREAIDRDMKDDANEVPIWERQRLQ
jgi:hypothetical protein